MNEGTKPDASDDRKLVRAAQKGDQAAFRTLVERYQRRVYQLALGMTKDPDDAMDISQETFVRVHRYLPSFKGDSSFFTWTYRIAMNLCLDQQRRAGRSQRVDAGDGADADQAEIEAAMDPPSHALAGPQRQALREAVIARAAAVRFDRLADRVLARVRQDGNRPLLERAGVWGNEMWTAHRGAFTAAAGLAVAACLALAVFVVPPRSAATGDGQ